MLILISPAKSLDFENKAQTNISSDPVFTDEANHLAEKLKAYTTDQLKELMDISYELAELNKGRFQLWNNNPERPATKQALLAFTGEVFRGINAKDFSDSELKFAQDHLRILSGLYGILRPMDLIQAYRLEMGTKIRIDDHKNLYEYWGSKITNEINKNLKNNEPLINLASNEYFKSIKKKELKSDIITPVFKDYKNGKLMTITVYAKNARGQMVRYIVENRISDPEKIKLFDINGYEYDENSSDEKNWVFVR